MKQGGTVEGLGGGAGELAGRPPGATGAPAAGRHRRGSSRATALICSCGRLCRGCCDPGQLRALDLRLKPAATVRCSAQGAAAPCDAIMRQHTHKARDTHSTHRSRRHRRLGCAAGGAGAGCQPLRRPRVADDRRSYGGGRRQPHRHCWPPAAEPVSGAQPPRACAAAAAAAVQQQRAGGGCAIAAASAAAAMWRAHAGCSTT